MIGELSTKGKALIPNPVNKILRKYWYGLLHYLQLQSIQSWLGEEGEDLLTYKAKVSKDLLHLWSNFIGENLVASDALPKCYALAAAIFISVV